MTKTIYQADFIQISTLIHKNDHNIITTQIIRD